MQRENVTQELILAWIFFRLPNSTHYLPSSECSGPVDMKKKRKKKQNEENAGLNVANADEKGKTKSYYKSYLFDALYFSRSQNSYGLSAWAAVSLFARPWKFKVELNSIFLRLIGVMLLLKEMNSAFQLGLHRSVCDGLLSESFQMLAWFQTQQTGVLMLTVCITDAWS